MNRAGRRGRAGIWMTTAVAVTAGMAGLIAATAMPGAALAAVTVPRAARPVLGRAWNAPLPPRWHGERPVTRG